MKNPLKPAKGKHWIASQGTEAVVGIVLILVGCMLCWDAFDNRGRKLPWPASGIAPW